jgi:sec-independent protein translocase protein TatA
MSINLFIGGLGGPELVIIFMLVVLLFGASKLPKLARASGEAMGEFQRGRENLERDIRDATSTESADDTSIDADATTDDADATTEVDVDATSA